MGDIKDHSAFLDVSWSGGNLRFLLPAEMSQVFAYETDYRIEQVTQTSELLADVSEGRPEIFWYKGKDVEIYLSLDLVVGASWKIDTCEQLRDILESLVKLALPSSPPGRGILGAQKVPEIIAIRMGDWFERKGIVKQVRMDVMGPWHPDTGLPFRAKVNLGIQYLYDTLPWNQDFSFKKG